MTSPREEFSFAPLGREDLPLLAGWLAAEHVAQWFGPAANAEQDPLGESDAVDRFIASLREQPIGMIQTYRWSDFAEGAVAVGAEAGDAGMDYLIGEPDLVGRGVGPAMIAAFLAHHVLSRAGVTAVRVDVSEANGRSWRCLEKLGFRRDREGVRVPGQDGPHYVYVRDADPGLRRARTDDASALADLWLRSRRAAQIPPAVHSDAEVRGWVRDVLLATSEVWVVTERDAPAGMIALRDEWIEQLYVAPEHQRRGHGGRLVELAQAERSSLMLWTFASNLGAQRFYEAHGFTRSGPSNEDNEEHAPAIRYSWMRAR